MKTIAKPIEMISWTETNGRVHPLRFKIENNDGEQQTCQIKRIYTTDLDRIAGNKVYRFNCEIAINALSKLCEIRYELESCKWSLFKI